MQREYLNWKFENLNGLSLKFSKYVDKKKDKEYCVMWSRTSSKLNIFYNEFYKSQKKQLSENILNNLESLGLAIWYCDDGSYDFDNRQVTLHTESFMEEGNELLKDWFLNTIGFKGNLKKVRKKYFCLRFNVESSDKFLALIKSDVMSMPSVMHYKLGHLLADNSDKLFEFKVKKKIRTKRYQQREYVKEVRGTFAKEYYKKNQEVILKKIKTSEYKEKRNEYMKMYYQIPKVKLKRKEYDKKRRATAEYRKKFNEYQREYRRKKYEGDAN